MNAIIDGRNRHRACEKLGIKPRVRTWTVPSGKDETEAIYGFVISENLIRRHLTPTQRAFAAAELTKQLAAGAKERMAEGGRKAAPGKPAKKGTEKIPDLSGEAREQAAELMKVNPHYVTDAQAIEEKAKEVAEMARQGKLGSMAEAKILADAEHATDFDNAARSSRRPPSVSVTGRKHRHPTLE